MKEWSRTRGLPRLLVAADGGRLCVKKREASTITTSVKGKLDVQYSENVEKIIISFVISKAKGFGISYIGKQGSSPT